jgi:hypothetical protein
MPSQIEQIEETRHERHGRMTKRLSATLALDKIKKIHEWEGCSESSAMFKKAAAQLDNEFKRQRLYMSSAEREDDEASCDGLENACESEEDAYESAEEECESDEDDYESDEGASSPEDNTRESVGRQETLYPSDEDVVMLSEEPVNCTDNVIREPAGPSSE